MSRVVAIVIMAAGCGAAKSNPPPEPEPPTGHEQVKDKGLRGDVAKPAHYVLRASGRKVGTFDTTTAGPDVHYHFHVLENGRGPEVDAAFHLASDGTPDLFKATGHREMGAAVAESFNRSGAKGTWASTEEHGSADATGRTFYAWSADGWIDPWLVPAALKSGGSIALWPGGEAKVVKVAEDNFAGKRLVGYALSGFGLSPAYTWFEPDGTWFGIATPQASLVPEGTADAVIDALAKKDAELMEARGDDIAHTTAHHPPPAGYAYTHARVLDVTKGAWVADQTVLVVGDKIKAVGLRVPVPLGAETIDLAGKALIPGLVDMHSHTDRDGALLDIATGVTTVRDVGNEPDDLDLMTQKFDEGGLVGPHVVRMGFIEGRGEKAASSRVTAETVDEAHAAVEFFAKRHYDGIKIYNSVKPELVPVLAADAHKRGMLVVGHIPVHMLAHEAIDAGYDGIEHVNMLFLNFLATHDTDTRDTTRFTLVGDHAAELDLDGAPMREFIAQLVKHHTIIDPTLGAFEHLYIGVPGELLPDFKDELLRLPLQLQRVNLQPELPISADNKDRYTRAWTQIEALVKKLWQAKVTLVAGTDSGITGIALQHELALLVQCGIPAAEVLRMATLDSARAMKQDKLFGSVTAGKRADLVVIDGDPVADIAAVRKVVSTMRAGVIYEAAPLLAALSVKP